MDVARRQEWDVVEESQVGRAYECLMWGAEKCLMHVFYSVLYVCDGVHIVYLVFWWWQ